MCWWSTRRDWTPDATQFTATYAQNANLSLLAKGQQLVLNQEYQITFNANGGTVSPEQANTAGCKLVALPTPTRPGYTFDGWFTEAAGGTAVSTNTVFNEDATLYAHWTAADYAVTLNANGGTINSGDVTGYVYGVGAKLPTDVTREGYTFGGWYDNAALTGSRVTVITGTDTGDKTYWAKWTANPGSAPVFTLPDGPQKVTVQQGMQAKLTAAATNADRYQWYINRGDGKGYVAISGATGETYTTSAVTLDNDGYTYYCEAANAYGTGRSPVFTLRVSEAASTPPQTGDRSHTGLWLARCCSAWAASAPRASPP